MEVAKVRAGGDVGEDARRASQRMNARVGLGVVGRDDHKAAPANASASAGSRASAVTLAPALASVSARRAAAIPSPTTRTRFPLTLRNIGR